MWSSNITDKHLFNGELKIEVTYTKDSEKFTKTYEVSSLAELNRRIRTELNRLDSLVTEATSIAIGIYTPTADPVVPETQEEIDSAKWFRQLNRLRVFNELKALGGMPVAWQADLDALAAKVQSDARKVYLNNL